MLNNNVKKVVLVKCTGFFHLENVEFLNNSYDCCIISKYTFILFKNIYILHRSQAWRELEFDDIHKNNVTMHNVSVISSRSTNYGSDITNLITMKLNDHVNISKFYISLLIGREFSAFVSFTQFPFF